MTRVALELVADERYRQIDEEGYSDAHDDDHITGELARAAAFYATPAALRELRPIYDDAPHPTGTVPVGWPWDADHWKPRPDDRIRELVVAGALIVAEIDRIMRLERRTP